MSTVTPLACAQFRLERARKNLQAAQGNLVNAELETIRCEDEVQQLIVSDGHVCNCATMTDTYHCCRVHGGDGSDCPACSADNAYSVNLDRE